MMRLRRLDLDFFGHFSGKSFDFGETTEGQSDFHIVFGPNEAGKTTTMEGFLRLLYGFPHRDPYSFKHLKSNLKVTGALDIDGTIQDFTRLPSRANSLLNAQGVPIPETALQAVLCGLSMDDYRNLLCLDDATIEQGGEEIANSKGDIGRLLFSAAAGISGLSEVLDETAARASEFYKKGGSKSRFAQLKRNHDELSRQIRELDVTASGYRKLKQEFDLAEAGEKIIIGKRRAALLLKSQLHSIATALPLEDTLSQLEKDLEVTAHYPVTLDIDPETLVAMMMQRVKRVAEIARLKKTIDDKNVDRDKIKLRPDLVQSLQDVDGLKGLRARYDTSLIDLPKRQNKHRETLQQMQACLVDITGVGADTHDPKKYVLSDSALSDLEMKLQEVRDSEKAVLTCEAEKTDAIVTLETAQAALERLAATGQDGPDVQTILTRHNALRVVENVTAASHAVRTAERTFQQALSHLTYRGQSFAALPKLPVTTAEALDFSRQCQQAAHEISIQKTAVKDLEGRKKRLQAQMRVLESAANFVTDAEAITSRNTRDQLWQVHLDTLAKQTAEDFSQAMRVDDRKSAARQTRAKELGELRQLQLDHVETESNCENAQSLLGDADTQGKVLSSRLKDLAMSVGLPGDILSGAFADWIRDAEAARYVFEALELERQDAVAPTKAADALCALLGAALKEPDASLDVLMMLARADVEARADEARDLSSAKEIVKTASKDLARRKIHVSDASKTLSHAQAHWTDTLQATFGQAAFGDLPETISLHRIIPALHKLHALNVGLISAQQQIDGMTRDQDAFHVRMSSILQAYPDLRMQPQDTALAALEKQGAEARKGQEKWQELTQSLSENEGHLIAEQAALDALHEQVRVLAARFDDTIATDALEDLRAAVVAGNEAIQKRAKAIALQQQLQLTLNVSTRDAVRTALVGKTLEETRAALEEVDRDIDVLEDQLIEVVEARATKQTALGAVTGGDDIAILVARKRTIEAEMQSGMTRYLTERFGHRLADQAIRLYRDKHRSGMMQAAEKAFCQLTNGAYTQLLSHPDGASETLVAIQAKDGAAKQAHAMSKGTRFQLYLALRGAAYEQMAANGTVLPFFCDDIFETFDEARTRAACGLMQGIGHIGQAIYLTHHQHVVDIARDVCGDGVTIHSI